MKKLTLFFVATLFSALSFAALNPFAYGLSSKLSADETTLTINYSLNAQATSVNIVILNGETVVKTVNCNSLGLSKGSYTTTIPTDDLPKTTSLTWKVEVTGNSVKSPTIQSEVFNFYLPYGLDCDVDPESDYLGNWYVIEANKHSKIGYVSSDVQRGLYAFNAALEGIKNKNGTYGFTGGINVGALESDKNSAGSLLNFYRVATSGGRIFIGRFRAGDAYHPIVEANPADLDAAFTSVYTSGEAVSIDAIGHGKDLKLVMLNKNFEVLEYDLGTAKSIATASRSLSKTNVGIVRTDATITYDNEGGVWFNQHRSEATETCATIAHLTSNNVDYHNVRNGLTHNNCDNGGIAVSPDGKQLAVVGAGTYKLTIYNITKTDGQIQLTEAYTIDTDGKNHTALSWDYAGNLYVANRSAETITFYAMPYSGTVATPCASKYVFELQESVGTIYTVTATASPAKGGTVAGAGEYEENTEIHLTATANRGYRFVNWTIGSTTETANPLTLTVTDNIAATANFEALNQYTINVTSNDVNMGTVSGGGTYYEDETVTLTATPKTGYRFVSWSNSSTEATLSFAASENLDLTATFEIRTYTLTSFSNDEAKGTVTGAGTYNHGATATLTATPKAGYKLLYWSDRSIDNTRTVTMTKNEALSAYFVKIYDEEPTFTIEKLWENTNVPATSSGFQAVGWDGKIYMQNKTTQKIMSYSNGTDAAVEYATSNAHSQQIAVDDAGNFVLRNTAGNFYDATTNSLLIIKNGETVGRVIDFTPAITGRCDFYSASGNFFSEEGGYVYLYCQSKNYVNRVYIKNGGKTNSDIVVDAVGNAISAGQTQNHVMVDIFGNLTAHCRSTAVNVINVHTNESKSLTLPNYKLSTVGSCTFELGGKELIAYNIKGTDYSSEWNIYNMTDKKSLSNEVLYAVDKANSTNNAANWLNVQVVDENTAYIYQFCPKKAVALWKVSVDIFHTVSATATNGTVTGSGRYKEGTTATLTATPNAGYHFINWTKAGVEVSTDATYSFTVTEDAELVANFKVILRDTENNEAILTSLDGQTADITVYRSLTGDMYNTLCLPFDLATLVGTPLANTTVWQYNGTTEQGDEIFLEFEEVTSITAGQPYLVEPDADIEAPMEFEGVTISKVNGSEVTQSAVTMHGILHPTELQADDKSILFLVANNELAWANVTANMNGMRAYFQVNEPSLQSARTRAYIRKAPTVATDMENITTTDTEIKKVIYNGNIYIIRGDEVYTIQGTKVK